jgi:hypothetical protein
MALPPFYKWKWGKGRPEVTEKGGGGTLGFKYYFIFVRFIDYSYCERTDGGRGKKLKGKNWEKGGQKRKIPCC